VLQPIRASNNSGDLVGAMTGFLRAKELQPKIISCSWGGDQDYPPDGQPDASELAFAAEIQDAISQGILVNYFWRFAQAAAPALAIEPIPSQIGNDIADVERAIESFARVPNGGLLVVPDATIIAHRDPFISLAARYRLPAVYPWRYFVTAGALMSYGIDNIDVLQKAASYVDRILRGAKPVDLPVQAPTKYETAVNLKTAKALGLTIPPTLLATADEVIE
jgi:ABC transporter substrate binding protein